jgi:TPP-dependent pyruvate/acetoin dehydrogenase alpha subunit
MKTKTRQTKATAVPDAPAGEHVFSLISNEKLRALYSFMVKCRMIEERAGKVIPQRGRAGIGTVGQEAALVAVAIDLRPDDTVLSSDHETLIRFIAGAPLQTIFGQPGLTSLSSAIGIALANKTQKNGRIVVVFSDRENYSADAWREALDVAGTHELPMIFVRPNAQIDESSNAILKLNVTAPTHHVPAIPVDGNDAVAVYRVAYESINRARKGHGATLIECASFRLHHEINLKKNDDAIANMEEYLVRKSLFNDELKESVVAAFGKELDALSKLAASSHSPN